MTEPTTSATAAEDAAIAEVEQELALAFSRMRSRWKEIANAVQPGLQPAGYKILATVLHLGGASGNTLATTLDMDKSVVSRQARHLEKWGLITTRTDNADRRTHILEATPTAVERFQAVRTAHRDQLRALLRDQAPERVQAMVDLLRLMNAL